jgi:glycerophosphoryl diester phosphodiesterase
MAAFLKAEQSGADGLELDIHLSHDGIPVVIHDETLDRTTNACGPVSGLTWEQLQRLDAGSWFSPCHAAESVPSLSEVLRVFERRLRINIEIKQAVAGEAVLKTLAEFPRADVVISSFDQELLCFMRHLDNELPLAVLFDRGNWRQAVRLAVNIRAIALHPNVALVHRPMIAACRACNLAVHTWTVDDAGLYRSLWRAGINGVFTNYPARFCRPGETAFKAPGEIS